jgi:hypothetical protein
MALGYVTLPATGEKVAADALAGGELVQYIKGISGTADSEVPIAAGHGAETNGWRVSVGTQTLTTLEGTKAGSGENELVATPGANKRLVVSAFSVQNETTTNLTLILHSAATTNGWRCYAANRGDGMARVFAPGREWCLNTNENLSLNISAAKTCGFSVMYWTEDV